MQVGGIIARGVSRKKELRRHKLKIQKRFSKQIEKGMFEGHGKFWKCGIRTSEVGGEEQAEGPGSCCLI